MYLKLELELELTTHACRTIVRIHLQSFFPTYFIALCVV